MNQTNYKRHGFEKQPTSPGNASTIDFDTMGSDVIVSMGSRITCGGRLPYGSTMPETTPHIALNHFTASGEF
jgi:hypothetical protein